MKKSKISERIRANAYYKRRRDNRTDEEKQEQSAIAKAKRIANGSQIVKECPVFKQVSEEEKQVLFKQLGSKELRAKIKNMFYGKCTFALQDELLGKTTLKAIEKIHMYNPELSSFSTWCCNIAYKELLQQFRQNKRFVDIEDKTVLDNICSYEQEHIVEQNLELLDIYKEALQEIKKSKALNKYGLVDAFITWHTEPSNNRKTLYQIADELGLPGATVRTIFKRTRHQIEQKITPIQWENMI